MGENQLDVFFLVEPSQRFPISPEARRDCKLVRFFGGSSLVHIAIGDGEAVLSADYQITAYYPQASYERLPSIEHRIHIPLTGPVDLEGFYNAKRVSKWCVFGKWLTRGLIRTRDCVCTTKIILARAGILVPRRVWAPIHLYQWLMRQGYEERPRRPDRKQRRLNRLLRRGAGVERRSVTAERGGTDRPDR